MILFLATLFFTSTRVFIKKVDFDNKSVVITFSRGYFFGSKYEVSFEKLVGLIKTHNVKMPEDLFKYLVKHKYIDSNSVDNLIINDDIDIEDHSYIPTEFEITDDYINGFSYGGRVSPHLSEYTGDSWKFLVTPYDYVCNYEKIEEFFDERSQKFIVFYGVYLNHILNLSPITRYPFRFCLRLLDCFKIK